MNVAHLDQQLSLWFEGICQPLPQTWDWWDPLRIVSAAGSEGGHQSLSTPSIWLALPSASLQAGRADHPPQKHNPGKVKREHAEQGTIFLH